jgi:hypothetical protein
MTVSEQPLYVGQAKEVKAEGRYPFLAIEIDLDELKQKLTNDLIKTWTDKQGRERRVLKLICSPVKPENVNEYRTHSIKIDTWKPTPKHADDKPNQKRAGDDYRRRMIEGSDNDDIADVVPF